jgi:hypothetical protein
MCLAQHSIDLERMELEIHVAALAAGAALPQAQNHVLFRRTGRCRRKNRRRAVRAGKSKRMGWKSLQFAISILATSRLDPGGGRG